MHSNEGLCGDLVSVGSVGTSYTNGIGSTNLGNACQSPPLISSTGMMTDPSDTSSSSNMGVVAGGGAAGGVLALLAGIGAYLYLRTRRAASQVRASILHVHIHTHTKFTTHSHTIVPSARICQSSPRLPDERG